MVVSHALADHLGALHGLGLREEMQVMVHGVKDAPLNRLQPIPDVGEGPSGDDRHGVIEVAPARGVVE
jgi:hypothetical protein